MPRITVVSKWTFNEFPFFSGLFKGHLKKINKENKAQEIINTWKWDYKDGRRISSNVVKYHHHVCEVYLSTISKCVRICSVIFAICILVDLSFHNPNLIVFPIEEVEFTVYCKFTIDISFIYAYGEYDVL